MLLLNLILEEKVNLKRKKRESSNIKRGEVDSLYVKEQKKGSMQKRREPKIIKNLKVCKTYMYLASKKKDKQPS